MCCCALILLLCANVCALRRACRYTINTDGTNLTQITFEGTFNSFPMFSPDGKWLVWASNRNTTGYGMIDIYVATWGPTARYGRGLEQSATRVGQY